MADNRNQNWNQEENRSQQRDQQNQAPGTEQRTGSSMGHQNRNQQGSLDQQSGSTSESNLGEQSERSSRDVETEDI